MEEGSFHASVANKVICENKVRERIKCYFCPAFHVNKVAVVMELGYVHIATLE